MLFFVFCWTKSLDFLYFFGGEGHFYYEPFFQGLAWSCAASLVSLPQDISGLFDRRKSFRLESPSFCFPPWFWIWLYNDIIYDFNASVCHCWSQQNKVQFLRIYVCISLSLLSITPAACGSPWPGNRRWGRWKGQASHPRLAVADRRWRRPAACSTACQQVRNRSKRDIFMT